MKMKFKLTNSLLIIGFFMLVLVSSASLIFALKIWPTDTSTNASIEGDFTTQATGTVFNKKVAVVIYNPIMNDGQKLTANRGWNDPDTLIAQYIDWLKITTANKVNYTVVHRNEINDFTTFTDGRKYNPTTYLACLSNSNNCFVNTGGNLMMMDYPTTINSLGVCGLFNSGTIDEVWMMGAPYFGWWEANQAGVGAFSTNGPVVPDTSCNAPMNIMGFSYERGVSEMVEDLMHRTEGTIRTVYGSENQNSISHNWNSLTLVDYLSPAYAFSGCGTCHYAPNSTSDYDWSNTRSVSTYCDEFYDYPDPININNRKTVTCSEWGCNSLGYFRWWMRHLPTQPGVAPDNKYADWWKYILEPNSVYDELIYVPPTTAAPTTIRPTTVVPTTIRPTTIVPTTRVPSSIVPTTVLPTTKLPTVTPTQTVTVTEIPKNEDELLAEWEEHIIVPRGTNQEDDEDIIDITSKPLITSVITDNPKAINEAAENLKTLPVAARAVLSLTMFGISGASFVIGIKAFLKLLV